MATKWKCLGECGKEFGVGDWECAPGVSHVVAAKDYYMDDAPYDPSGISFKHSRTTVCNVPPERTVVDAQTGQPTRMVGGNVVFRGGYYSSSNAEEQFYLDRAKVDVGRARWEAKYLTREDKDKKREIEISAKEREVAKREQEVNDLLERVKAEKGVPPKKKDVASVNG